MLQQPGDRHRIARPQCGLEKQPRQATGACGRKRCTSRIVGHDAEAQKFRRHPPRKVAVGGDQCGLAFLAAVQGEPERDSDRRRLLALVGRFDQRGILEGGRKLVLIDGVGEGRSSCSLPEPARGHGT